MKWEIEQFYSFLNCTDVDIVCGRPDDFYDGYDFTAQGTVSVAAYHENEDNSPFAANYDTITIRGVECEDDFYIISNDLGIKELTALSKVKIQLQKEAENNGWVYNEKYNCWDFRGKKE